MRWDFVDTLFALAIALCLALVISCDLVPRARAQITADVLTWKAPTTRADGTPLAASEILQYRLSWSAAPGGPYTAGSATVPGTEPTWTRSNRPAGRACYVAATIDTAGLVSANSNEVCTEKCLLGQRVNAAGTCVALALPNPPAELGVS